MDWLWSGLFLAFLGLLSCLITWLIFKIFPGLKKLNWKVLAGLFFFFKIFDTHSTWLCFVKTKDYEGEANFVFSLFYKILGLGPWLSFVLCTIIAILIGILAIKMFVSARHYFIAFCIVVAIFLAVVNNYLGAWLF